MNDQDWNMTRQFEAYADDRKRHGYRSKVIAAIFSVASILSITGTASATWIKTSPSGTAGAAAATMTVPGTPSLTGAGCVGSSHKYKVNVSWSAASPGSPAYTIDWTLTSGTGANGSATNQSSGAQIQVSATGVASYSIKVQAGLGNNWSTTSGTSPITTASC